MFAERIIWISKTRLPYDDEHLSANISVVLLSNCLQEYHWKLKVQNTNFEYSNASEDDLQIFQ